MKKLIIILGLLTLLKAVKVKRTIYTGIINAAEVCKYVEDCVAFGSAADLYAVPAISAEFYKAGTQAATDITDAIATYALSPTTGNLEKIAVKRIAGLAWLDLYSNQVEEIANADGNRATREEAYANILLSNLTPQKLVSASKGDPETPKLTGEITGAYILQLEVTNGETYIPSQTNFVLVQLPAFTTELTPDPTVELKNGQLIIKGASGESITKSVSGKGKSTKLTFSASGSRYAAYAYAQNGKKQLSDLSAKIIITT